MSRHNFGWKPSPFDGRDIIFDPASFRPDVEIFDPGITMLEHPYPPRDQGDTVPCCVSCAVVTCMETLDYQDGDATELSMMFHYYMARKDRRYLSRITLRDGLKITTNKGVCPSKLHAPPIDREGAGQKPGKDAITAAGRYRVVYDPVRRKYRYHLIPDTDRVTHWRNALKSKLPILFGFYVTDAYWDIKKSSPFHGNISDRTSESGHAVVALGFDDRKEAFKIKDSQGTRFGDQGYWWLPYPLARTRLIHEAWVIEKISY